MLAEAIYLLCVFYLLSVLLNKLRPKQVVSPYGKAVLITGCDSGFGNQLAQRLNQIGFKVYATVFSTGSVGSQELKTRAVFADKMIVLKMNVTNDGEVNEVFAKVKRDLQTSNHVLWAVVNNAGINSTSPLEWGTIDNYYNQFEVNLFGVVRVTRAFLPLIRASQGRIVNIVSILGRFSLKLSGIYAMNKHALIAFSDTLRREITRFNVKVTTIEPAFFRTAITNTTSLNQQLEQNWNQSTDEVKASYVNFEYERKLVDNLGNLVVVSDNTEAVVNDIIDSISNCRPKNRYRPIVGIKNKIEMFIALYFPTDFFDKLSSIKEKIAVH